MNKLAAILITLLIVITLFVTVKNPAMHNQIMITDANFTFVEETSEPQNVPVQVTPQKNQPQKTVQPQKQTVPRPAVNTTRTPTPAVKTSQVKTTPTKPKTVQQTQVKQTASKSVSQGSAKTQQPKKETKTQPQKVVKESPTVVHQLTEQEEIIAWNKWRSDLQNQVMKDTKIAAPLGTAFKFSFTVDKFGNISNIKTWSLNPVYTETAVRVIKPVLFSYQGKPVLAFPQGTKRVITNVTGGFVMAESTGFSSPSDFSDYERVKK